MSETTYRVILSTDGKHTVIVESDDPVAIKTGSAWAKATYEMIVASYGLKNEQHVTKNGEKANGISSPVCEVHGVPMVNQMGRYGAFWSCHQRNEDGSFCSYRPFERL